jgi:hypothetical protein
MGGNGYLVTYYTRTGNTRKVAEAIFDALPEPKEIRPIAEVESVESYRLAFVGFPLWQFAPAPPAAEFLRAKCAHARIAVFHTQGSAPDFWQVTEVEDRIRGLCAAHIVDRFSCAAEVSDDVIQMIETIPQYAPFAAQARKTKGLPDARSLDEARAFAKRLAETF